MQSSTTDRRFTGAAARPARIALVAMLAMVPLSGCLMKSDVVGGLNETYHAGYIPDEFALQQVPIGASRDQVLIALGTPSTTMNFGNESFYYISQTRFRRALFQRQKVTDQRVLAIYFDAKGKVTQISNYGLKDGRVFDFVNQTTPTSGKDTGFLQQVLSGTVPVGGSNPFGGG